MGKTGVIIARFQSPYLHDGHKSIIDAVRTRHNKVVIILGVSSVLGSRRNPLDFFTRERMIKDCYPDLVILPLPDHPLDFRWSSNLDALLNSAFPGSRFVLYGSRDSFITHYSGTNEVFELPENGTYSSTLIREQISDRVLNSEEFRTGIIYAHSNAYLKVYPTVDVAVLRKNKTEVLLGRKEIDMKWRLPGGFTDPADDSYEMAAAREMKEECGNIEVGPMLYEGSFRVDDWRYRREVDKIITCLYSTEFVSGEPRGSDDIADVAWFGWKEVSRMIEEHQTAEEHSPQFLTLLKKYTH